MKKLNLYKKIYKSLLLIIIILLAASSVYIYEEKRINSIKLFDKYYSKALTEFNFAVIDSSIGNYNYKLKDSYHDQGCAKAKEYCIVARSAYASSIGYLQRAINNFEQAKNASKEEYKVLLDNYIKASSVSIEINQAIYGACVSYENACDYYTQGLKDEGDKEIEEGNKKISQHASLIKLYNSYLSQIDALEKGI